MTFILQAVLCSLAITALLGACLRVAGVTGSTGLERMVAAAIAPGGKGCTKSGAASDAAAAMGLSALRWAAHDQALHAHDPIAFAGWTMVGQLAGDRSQRRLPLIPRRAPCAEVRRVTRRAWVVTTAPG